MSELRADTLSLIDTATLWPQLHRLDTEAVAARGAGHLFVSSGLAATGLTRLPRIPRTSVLGVRGGLRYKGVVVARELAGGAGWEIVSTRLAQESDDPTLEALLVGAQKECTARGAHTLLVRYPEGSPHGGAFHRSGFTPHTLECLHTLPAAEGVDPTDKFRPATSRDRSGIFRLYCRVVPEHVRKREAATQQEWRSLLDSYECDQGFVAPGEDHPAIWIGGGEREGRILCDESARHLIQDALQLLGKLLDRGGVLVLPEYQPDIEREALELGCERLGTRLLCARRLAILNPLKEAQKVPVPGTVTY
ncbi:MAG TPA: hypothetical protein QGF35_02740 [Dehalococcoidia bacterium]|nr:hypothetical protein [Dehalococcoidia bacterium]